MALFSVKPYVKPAPFFYVVSPKGVDTCNNVALALGWADTLVEQCKAPWAIVMDDNGMQRTAHTARSVTFKRWN